jgi:hypothetical protein
MADIDATARTLAIFSACGTPATALPEGPVG